MIVQYYLRSFKNPEAALRSLEENWAIEVNRNTPGLISLNYHQFKSGIDAMTNECRALILTYPSFDVVARSFPRFRNHGEKGAAHVDWTRARALEKVDGSLLNVSFYNGQWVCHTRSVPLGSGPVGDWGFTYADAFKRLVPDPDSLFKNKQWTYTFEYIGPYNRIVTPYDKEELIFLALFDNEQGEIDTKDAPEVLAAFRSPKEYACSSLDDIKAMITELPPIDEGYVIVDNKYNRVKVKNPSWLALHHSVNAGGPCSYKRLVELVVAGEAKEVIVYFPELQEKIALIEEKISLAETEMEDLWQEVSSIDDQKSFALKVKDSRHSAFLFQRKRDRSLSAKNFLTRILTPEKLTVYLFGEK